MQSRKRHMRKYDEMDISNSKLLWIVNEDEHYYADCVYHNITYGISYSGDDYAPYVNSDLYIGGYLDGSLNIICGFGAVCAKGFHPDTICKSIEEAKELCEKHYQRFKSNTILNARVFVKC